jgi:hypothetical protein
VSPFFDTSSSTDSVELAAGATVAITLSSWSSGPRGGFAVQSTTAPGSDFLRVWQDHYAVNNSSTSRANISVRPGTPPGRRGIVMVVSEGFPVVTSWPILVTTR